MVEFKIQVEDSFVQRLGHQEIERYLQNSMQKIIIKLAAQEILSDLDSIDLDNDEEWQISRNLAWEQEKSKFVA